MFSYLERNDGTSVLSTAEYRAATVTPMLTTLRIHQEKTQSLLNHLNGSHEKKFPTFIPSGVVSVIRNRRGDTKNFVIDWKTISEDAYSTFMKRVDECQKPTRVVAGQTLRSENKIFLFPDAIYYKLLFNRADDRERSRWGEKLTYDKMYDLLQEQTRIQCVSTFIHECTHAVQPDTSEFDWTSSQAFLKSVVLHRYRVDKDEKDAGKRADDPENIVRAKEAVSLSFPYDRERMVQLVEMTCHYYHQKFRNF